MIAIAQQALTSLRIGDEMDASEFCPKCGNILFEDAQGKFCLSCESGRQKTKDKPLDKGSS